MPQGRCFRGVAPLWGYPIKILLVPEDGSGLLRPAMNIKRIVDDSFFVLGFFITGFYFV
jgi:hypothetical protein